MQPQPLAVNAQDHLPGFNDSAFARTLLFALKSSGQHRGGTLARAGFC